jgi:hypothetical protein
MYVVELGAGFSPGLFCFHLLSTIPPLLHTYLLPCNSPDQAAHFPIFGIQSEDFNSNRHPAGLFGIQAEDFISNR